MDTNAEFLKLTIHVKYKCLKTGKIIHKKISIYETTWNEKDSRYECVVKCPECDKYHKIILD